MLTMPYALIISIVFKHECHEEAAALACRAVQSDLAKAGLVVNVNKSRLEPTQQCTWLGFDIDLAKECI